jgi:hypothetical protein
MVLTGDGHQAMVDQPLKALGQKRHIALRIPFYIPAILEIAQTDLVLTVPRTQMGILRMPVRLQNLSWWWKEANRLIIIRLLARADEEPRKITPKPNHPISCENY